MAFPILVRGSSMALLLMKIRETNPLWDQVPHGLCEMLHQQLIGPDRAQSHL